MFNNNANILLLCVCVWVYYTGMILLFASAIPRYITVYVIIRAAVLFEAKGRSLRMGLKKGEKITRRTK